jgi:hypothetical protein
LLWDNAQVLSHRSLTAPAGMVLFLCSPSCTRYEAVGVKASRFDFCERARTHESRTGDGRVQDESRRWSPRSRDDCLPACGPLHRARWREAHGYPIGHRAAIGGRSSERRPVQRTGKSPAWPISSQGHLKPAHRAVRKPERCGQAPAWPARVLGCPGTRAERCGHAALPCSRHERARCAVLRPKRCS